MDSFLRDTSDEIVVLLLLISCVGGTGASTILIAIALANYILHLCNN